MVAKIKKKKKQFLGHTMERKKPWLVFDESVGMRSPSRSIFPWLLISKYALTRYKSLRPYFHNKGKLLRCCCFIHCRVLLQLFPRVPKQKAYPLKT